MIPLKGQLEKHLFSSKPTQFFGGVPVIKLQDCQGLSLGWAVVSLGPLRWQKPRRCWNNERRRSKKIPSDTVDGRNPKQPPGIHKTPRNLRNWYQKLPFLNRVTFSKAHHFGALQPLVFGSVKTLEITGQNNQPQLVSSRRISDPSTVFGGSIWSQGSQGSRGVQGEGVFLGNPKDVVWEDWGTLGKPLPLDPPPPLTTL